jgi:predicted aspartyl protease
VSQDKLEDGMRVLMCFLVVAVMSGMLVAEPKGDLQVVRLNIKPDESTTLKFDFVNRHLIVIPVVLNGSGPYKFLLDTGAGITVISKRLANNLNLPNGRSESVSSAGGYIAVEMRRLQTLHMGDIRITDPEVAVADFDLMKSMKVDGILGGDRLKFFRVSIDYSKQTVRIRRA